MFLENARFGGYKLKSMIGKGGVAEVWLADQLALDREVAVKVISSELVSGDDSDFIGRFKREAHSVGRLDHPGILPVFDYGEADGYLYLVMPYARGGNLRTWVRRNPPTKEEIAAIFENITGGIGHAHSHGLVHRDLKPANILLNEEGRAYIGDFSIAKTMDNNTNLTQAGIILGSPSYMAPEQFLGHADKRSDLYSMGLILFFMLTGRKLYNGRMPFEIGKRHLEEPIPLPDPQVPPEYEPFLYKVLAKNPDERYQSANEMLKGFKEIARNSHSSSYNSGTVSSTIRPTTLRPPVSPRPAPPDEARWRQENAGNAQPAASEARWRQEKRGEFQPPPEGTLWREFDPSLNSFGELKPHPDNSKGNPAEAQWMQEKRGGNPPPHAPQQRGGPPPVADPARWMQEKNGGVPGPAPAPNPARPDPAYERYSREKNLPPQSGQPIPGPAQAYRPPTAPPAGSLGQQAQWMHEKRGGVPPPGQEAQWMREKCAVPGQANFRPQGFNPNQPGGPAHPPVTRVKRKQPIWLFAIIGVLLIGILAAGAVLLINGGGKGTATPTAQANNATTAAAPSGAATTAAAPSGPTVTTPAATTAPAGNTPNPPTVAAGTGAVPLSGHAGPVNAVNWSANGQFFLTASDDKTIKVWDAATNKVVKTLDDKAKPITDRVISAAFSSDGQFVVATLADNSVNVYSFNNGSAVAQVKGDLAVPAAFSGDQTLVAFAGSRTIHSFDLKKNANGPEYPYFDPSVSGLAPSALAFSQDNSTLAVGLNNGRIILYAAATGKPLMEIEPPSGAKAGVRQLAWYGNGTTHLAVGREGSFRLCRSSRPV